MSQEHYLKLKRRFVFCQIVRGLTAIVLILGLVVLFSTLFSDTLEKARCYLLSKQYLVYLSFLLSELFGSLFPPEIFILTVSRSSTWIYIWGVLLLSLISYVAALGVYFLGRYLQRTSLFQRLLGRFYRRELRQLKRFGGLLVVLAALTPISFTVVCCLIGTTGFSSKQFAFYATARHLRFVLYAYSMWYLTSNTPC